MKLTEPKLASQVGVFTSATIISQAITILAAILTRRYLGPLNTGVWSMIVLVLTYSAFTRLGTHAAASREVPFCMGKGDSVRAESIKNNAFSFSILTALISAAVVLICAFIFRHRLESTVFYSLVFASAFVLLQRVNNLYLCFARAYRRFHLISKQMILSSVANILLIVTLAYPFGMYGFLLAMLLSFVFNIAYLAYYQKSMFSWSFQVSEIKKSVTFGIPLMSVCVSCLV